MNTAVFATAMDDYMDDNCAQQQPCSRGQWANKREYVLAVAGQIIGLSNFWRFPYLCFKNGGGKYVAVKRQWSSPVNHWDTEYLLLGVFLIPYVVFLVTCGIPLFFAETSLGQFSRESGVTCWNSICLLAKGLLSHFLHLKCFLSLSLHLYSDMQSFMKNLTKILMLLLLGLGYGQQLVVFYYVCHYIVILAWAFLYLFSSFNTELLWSSCNNTWNTGTGNVSHRFQGFTFSNNPRRRTVHVRPIKMYV